MNLRISNLSYQRDMRIRATDSARLFDGTDLFTTTDTTVSLIPKEGRMIEGTLQLFPNKKLVTLATDLKSQRVIVRAGGDREMVIPLDQNIAIEWDNDVMGISAYR